MTTLQLDESRPAALPPWVRLRFDKVRDRWVLLAPERVLFPCTTSVEIINRLPQAATLGALIDGLAAEYEAPREAIAADVNAMLADLAAQGFLTQPAPEASLV
jgi:pyrroloquinoline quinone biosynthesis protein D